MRMGGGRAGLRAGGRLREGVALAEGGRLTAGGGCGRPEGGVAGGTTA